jgi:hypothetical protein
VVIVIEGILKKRRCGTIVATKDSILGNPLTEEPYEDDILMLSDGVLCEVSSTTLNEALGDNLKNIISSKKGLAHLVSILI